MSSDAEPQLASGAEAPLAPRDTLGHAFVAARAGKRRDGAATILNAFYVDDRVRRMYVQLAFQFRQVDYAAELRQRSRAPLLRHLRTPNSDERDAASRRLQPGVRPCDERISLHTQGKQR